MAHDSSSVRGNASLAFWLFWGCACTLVFALPAPAQSPNAPPVSSNSYFLRAWQTDDGLSDNNVTGIAQTGDGYLWVTTGGGISRFDGRRFQQLSRFFSDATHYRSFQSIGVDERGKLWVVADNGAISWVNPEANEFGTQTKGMVNPEVQSMVVGAGGEVWVSHSALYARVTHIQGEQVVEYGGKGVFPGSGRCTLAQGRDGRLWFAQRDCLGIFRAGQWVKLLPLPGRPARIAAARTGGVWLSSGNQVWRFEEGQPLSLKAEVPSAFNLQATAMLEDRAGRLWFGTSEGELFCLEGTRVQRIATSLPQVTCLFEDAEGSLWVGTKGGGLSRVRPVVVEMVSAEPGLPSPSLLSVCEDTGGRLWVTTANGILARQSETGWAVLSTNRNWPGGEARCLVADRTGGVWIGTRDSGLYHWENGNYSTLRKTNGLASDAVSSLLLTPNCTQNSMRVP